ncbi:hypothetical protein E2P81_ATG10378 [Venturia nashicola]|nr:hypothetical protein E2P81_ATG10378 [Venturia nashicola]
MSYSRQRPKAHIFFVSHGFLNPWLISECAEHQRVTDFSFTERRPRKISFGHVRLNNGMLRARDTTSVFNDKHCNEDRNLHSNLHVRKHSYSRFNQPRPGGSSLFAPPKKGDLTSILVEELAKTNISELAGRCVPDSISCQRCSLNIVWLFAQ